MEGARHRKPGGWCDRDLELYNVTADAHPIHIHEVIFEVVNRQDIVVFEDQKQVQINPASPPTAAGALGDWLQATPWLPIPDK